MFPTERPRIAAIAAILVVMFLLQFLVSEHYGSPLFLVKPTETATPR